jgi:type IV secretory pathway TrbD component
MVNYRDPAKVARDLCACALSSGSRALALIHLTLFFTGTVVKLWHTVDGLYMWVFSVTQTFKFHAAYPLIFQLGVLHYPRLRMECHSTASPLPVVDMGP